MARGTYCISILMPFYALVKHLSTTEDSVGMNLIAILSGPPVLHK